MLCVEERNNCVKDRFNCGVSTKRIFEKKTPEITEKIVEIKK